MDRLLITRLGHLGDGIAEDGSAHPLTLPGDSVCLDDGSRIIGSASTRATPPCPHFGTCGGCNLQHASDAFVADWKREVIVRALAARDLPAPIRRMHTSPPGSRRRATFSGKRTKKTVQIGFHQRASDLIVDIPECKVLSSEILGAVPALEVLTRIGASRKGEVKLAVTASDAGWDVDVREAKALDPDMRVSLARAADAHDLARLTWNGEPVATRRAPGQMMGRARVVPPPGAFLQATGPAEAAMVSAVREAAGAARRIVDLFAGCGTFTLPLAETADIHAVEAAADHLASLDAGWRHAEGLHSVTTETRDLFRRPLVPAELSKFDAVVIDPPRAGAEAQMAEIATSIAPVVAAVSCNPVTFARDAQLLVESGFNIDWIDVIDQFRWSSHVELVARLSR